MNAPGSPEVDPRVEAAREGIEMYAPESVNRNLVDPQEVRESNMSAMANGARPDDREPHDESPEYGRWVWGEEGDGYGVGEIEAPDQDTADFDEVMRVFGDFMADTGEKDEQYVTDGGRTGIPVGGYPSYVETSDDGDVTYMGDFPM